MSKPETVTGCSGRYSPSVPAHQTWAAAPPPPPQPASHPGSWGPQSPKGRAGSKATLLPFLACATSLLLSPDA